MNDYNNKNDVIVPEYSTQLNENDYQNENDYDNSNSNLLDPTFNE